jgi:CRP/FNR family transcriptional regulator, cyclic AMP receptor protein
MQRKEDLVAGVPLFSSLSTSELRDVVRLMDEIDIPAGRTIIHEGRTGGECFIVVDGMVEIRRDGERIAEVGPGDIVGELALLDKKPRSASAVTSTETRLLVLAPAEFRTLLSHHPGVREKIEASARERRSADLDSSAAD